MADPDLPPGFTADDAAPPLPDGFQEDAPAVQHVMHTFATRGTDGKEVRFQAPSDASDDDIRQAAFKATGSKLYLGSPVQNFDVKRDGSPLPDNRDTSFLEGVKQGVEQPWNRASEWLEGALNHGGEAIGLGRVGDKINSIGPALGMAGSTEAAEQQQQRDNANAQYRPSELGLTVGNIIGTAPLAKLPGGVATQGAVGGALLAPGKGWQDQAVGAAGGALGGVVASKLIGAASRVAAPVVNPALRTLIDAGVRVSPGQYARSLGTKVGDLAATVEERATSQPFVGSTIIGARQQAGDDFGRATINRALNPIGQSLPNHIQSGRDAVRYAGDQLGAEYDRLLPQLSATGDQQFLGDMANVHREAATLAPDRQTQFNAIVGDLGRYWQNGTTLTGDAFKDIETRLGGRVRTFLSSNDADQRELGQRLQDVLQATRDLAVRQNPQVGADLANVNRGWASLAQVERAGGNSRGDITPAGYSQAVKLSSATVRRRGYARGDALNQDLSDAASDVLPSRTGDSGTAGRELQESTAANIKGAAMVPLYKAAQAAVPLLTRTTNLSPQTAKLLQYGARAAPYVTPALEAEARRRLSSPNP